MGKHLLTAHCMAAIVLVGGGCTPRTGQVCDTSQGAGACLPSPATTSNQIRAFLAADAGPLDPPMQITGATVTNLTYPDVDLPEGGFFLQAESNGPAMFVALSALKGIGATVALGGRVSLQVTEKTVLANGMRVASGATHYLTLGDDLYAQVLSTTPPPNGPGLVVDYSDAGTDELLTRLDSHESQIIYLSGLIASEGSDAGPGHSSFEIITQGIPSPTPNIQLRIPADRVSYLNPVPGCSFTLRTGFMWRQGTIALPSADGSADLFVDCRSPASR